MRDEDLNIKYEDECVMLQSDIRLEDGEFVLTKWSKPWKRISFKTEKEMVEYFIGLWQDEDLDIINRIQKLRSFVE